MNLQVAEASLGNIDVLIGMDIIAFGDFAICNGQIFSYCLPPFEKPIDFVDKANRINPKNQKKIKKLH